MPRESHIIPWTEPLLPQAADWLCRGLTGFPWDLSATAVVVPSRQSGRRLRAALAERARAQGTGVLTPRIGTPEWFESVVLQSSAPAQAELITIWAEILLGLDLDEVRALVPIDPPRRDAAWALGFAEQLARLKGELGRALFDFEEVGRRTVGTECEPLRWEALARIERRWRERLAERGLGDPAALLRGGLETTPPPHGLRRIVVAGVADLSGAAEQLLARWSESIEIQILVHGDPALALHDAWGRPLAEAAARPLSLAGERCAVRSVKDPAELSERLAELAVAYAKNPTALSITLADPMLVPDVAAAFDARELAHHDPAGEPLGRGAVGRMIRLLAGLAGEDRLGAAEQLARCPSFCAFAVERRAWFARPADFSLELDRVLESRIPSGLEAALESAVAEDRQGLRQALEWLSAAASRFRREPFARTLAGLVGEVLEGVSGDRLGPEETQAADAIADEISAVASVESRHATLPREFWPALLGRIIDAGRLYPAKPDEAWDLQGWIELSFDGSAHAVIAGLNEGCVPETVKGDAFMPDSLRRHLGLDSNERRYARDRLLLEAAVRSRSRAGRVDILVAKLGSEGDPLQPSRLLFACSDDELVATARYLFEPLPPPRPKPPRVLPWRLHPLPVPLPPSLSASAIRSYLDCPFRYYLEYGLRARPLESDKRDLDARDFGTLCHTAFEAMAKDPVMREVEDGAMLADYLVSQLNAAVAEKFGRIRSFAIKLQLEAAAARLRAAAAVEVAQRAEGWRTVETERSWNLSIGGHRFSGVIDRIDRHEDGRIRVVDYKTADKARSPRDTHWGTVPVSSDHILPEARIEVDGRPRRWTDLQLPLYMLATKAMTGEDAGAGYFILPKTKEETELRIWEELGPDRLREAETCAVAVAEAIRSGRFWPPAPRPGWDDAYAALFPEGVAASLEPGPFTVEEGGAR